MSYNQRVYEITNAQHWNNEYVLEWDMNAFARRYGNGSLGENPLPFQFFVTPATSETNYVTLQMGTK